MSASDLTVLGEIARGGFGRVERVRDQAGKILARKVFDPSHELGIRDDRDLAKLRKRFEREVRIQKALAEHGMMPILRAELADDPPWFLMPLADKSYAEQVREDRAARKITAEPLLEILNGLQELHRLGYAHRDLKPDNVLLYDGRWRLSDFGLVADVERHATTRLTSTASIWGSQLYMAPEQTRDFRRAKEPADIYAFGCIVHDLVDGGSRTPYAVQTVKGPFDAIVRKCTATDPKRRFQNVAGLRSALVDVLRRSPSLVRSDVTQEWSKALTDISTWSDEQAANFAAHLEEAQRGDEGAVVAELTEEHLTAIAERFPEEWDRIALAYCDWARGGFTFSYCDVLVGRLEAIFLCKQSSLDARAAALVSAADVGSSNNRWYVMGRVRDMADRRLDENLAERVAIEIQASAASEARKDFVECAGGRIGEYHPRVAHVLAPKS